MRISFVLLCSFLGLVLNSQNWQPFISSKVYNYEINNSGFIDKSFAPIAQNDTLFFAPTMSICSTCTISIIDTFFFPSSDIWGNFALNHFDTSITFFGADTITLKPHAQTLESWQFSSGIYASVVNITTQSINGALDSVKIIQLSNFDTILLSKSNGIIQFKFSNIQGNYIQIGIDNQYGWQNFGWKEIFNFNIGDVLQYRRETISVSSTRSFFNKYIITSKTEYTDSVVYQIDNYQRIIENIYGMPFDNSTFSNIQVTNSKFDDEVNRLASEWKVLGIPTLTYYEVFNADTFKIIEDSLIEVNNQPNKYVARVYSPSYQYSYTYYKKFQKNLGLIYFDKSESDNYNVLELIGYYIGEDTVGVIKNDKFYTTLYTFENDNDISVYPNPISSDLIILSNEDRIRTIEIYNLQGSLMFYKEIASNQIQVDISKFPVGIYMLNILLQNGNRLNRKIVKNL